MLLVLLLLLLLRLELLELCLASGALGDVAAGAAGGVAADMAAGVLGGDVLACLEELLEEEDEKFESELIEALPAPLARLRLRGGAAFP